MSGSARLYTVCDADVCAAAGWSVVDFVTACLAGGARVVQFRAKRASSQWLLDSTSTLVELAASVDGAAIIVNDRADIARLAGAAGVHLGQDDLPPTAVRQVVGDSAVVGLSTHTQDQIAAAVQQPISYLAVGPVFRTVTKDTGYEPVGLDRVRAAALAAAPRGLPVVAIGGITLDRVRDVVLAGASDVAVIGDLLASGDPRTRVREYVTELARL